MKSRSAENYLILSDLQEPFGAKDGLKFAREVKKEFRVRDEHCLCVGDEVDEYFGSMYEKDPDALHTPQSEIFETIEKMREWYSLFPQMLVAESNHGMRWAKKAASAGIPSIMMRKYQEVIGAPKGWRWQRHWVVRGSRHRFMLTHGMGYSGVNSHRQMAVNEGISVVHGHLTHAGVAHIERKLDSLWGMCVGALIDTKSYAFHYGLDHKFKPSRGIGVVLDGGTTPIWIPYPYR